MAGHSKWANIKYRKQQADAKKGKVFSRCAKEIISAVKQGGIDPKANAKLRSALQKAKNANLPSEIIARNIKKASTFDQTDFEQLTYELYGHGGVGIIVDALTDNKNRTAADVRIITQKKGGRIAQPGSVAFNFSKQGVIQVRKEGSDTDAILNQAMMAGASDFDTTDGCFIIVTPPHQLYEVKQRLENVGFEIQEATLEMIPKTSVACGPKDRQANQALLHALETLDDIDMVFHNMEM